MTRFFDVEIDKQLNLLTIRNILHRIAVVTENQIKVSQLLILVSWGSVSAKKQSRQVLNFWNVEKSSILVRILRTQLTFINPGNFWRDFFRVEHLWYFWYFTYALWPLTQCAYGTCTKVCRRAKIGNEGKWRAKIWVIFIK